MANKPTGNQYMPFAALKGFDEKLREKEKIKEHRKILSEEQNEEINNVLLSLKRNMEVEVCYYYGNRYITIKGIYEKIDLIEKKITISNCKIPLNDIYYIKKNFD